MTRTSKYLNQDTIAALQSFQIEKIDREITDYLDTNNKMNTYNFYMLLALASLSEGFERKQQNHLLCGWCQIKLYKIITILSIMKVFKLSK